MFESSLYIFGFLGLIVLIGSFFLSKIIIKKYFELQKLKYSNVKINAIRALLTAFLALIAFIPLEFILNLIGYEITFSLNGYGLTAFFILSFAIVSIVMINKNQLENIKDKEETNLEINFPKKPKAENPLFYERVKELFLLKLEKTNLKLEYDEFEKILYGEYKQGFHKYFLLIYCDEGKFNKNIGVEEQQRVFDKLNSIKNKIFEIRENDIVDIFYLLENGEFQESKVNLITKTEDEFLNELIDFKPYLEELVTKYQNDKLFSAIAKDEDKFTLAQTFISPYFNEADIKLDSYIDSWLEEDNLKHLAILGDYGMGKSSFMKYYSFKLASEILNSQKIKRFPVFISLTNISPMHGGLKDRIGRFVSDKLGVSSKVFEKLINRGKIVFILDGFDEMGFIGTHKQRFKQFNAIWQLATKNNKILISGRPSYFPTEFELNTTLNVADKYEKFTKEQPYYELLKLDRFNETQIKESISKYYSKDKTKNYFGFISKNETLLDLCKRPSMMHIVREMLPTLTVDFNSDELSAGKLMNQYINYWIERQESKNIVSVFRDDETKRDFLIEFFRDLAVELYLGDKLKLPSKEIFKRLEEKLKTLNITNPSEKEGVESEILTGYFIEIDSKDDEEGFKFVHKSFFEYFVALKIMELIKAKEFKHKLMRVDWSFEIIDFMYDSIDKKCKGLNMPSLLCVANGEFFGKIRFILLKKINYIDKLIFETFNLINLPIILIAFVLINTYAFLVSKLTKEKFKNTRKLLLKSIISRNIFYQSVKIGLIKNELNLKNNVNLLIYFLKEKTLHEIMNFEFYKKIFPTYTKFIDIKLKNINFIKCNLTNVKFKNSLLENVNFKNSLFINGYFENCKFNSTDFKNINTKSSLSNLFSIRVLLFFSKVKINFNNISPQNIDTYTINSLKRLIQKQNLEIGKDIVGDKWLMEELKKPIREIEDKS